MAYDNKTKTDYAKSVSVQNGVPNTPIVYTYEKLLIAGDDTGVYDRDTYIAVVLDTVIEKDDFLATNKFVSTFSKVVISDLSQMLQTPIQPSVLYFIENDYQFSQVLFLDKSHLGANLKIEAVYGNASALTLADFIEIKNQLINSGGDISSLIAKTSTIKTPPIPNPDNITEFLGSVKATDIILEGEVRANKVILQELEAETISTQELSVNGELVISDTITTTLGSVISTTGNLEAPMGSVIANTGSFDNLLIGDFTATSVIANTVETSLIKQEGTPTDAIIRWTVPQGTINVPINTGSASYNLTRQFPALPTLNSGYEPIAFTVLNQGLATAALKFPVFTGRRGYIIRLIVYGTLAGGDNNARSWKIELRRGDSTSTFVASTYSIVPPQASIIEDANVQFSTFTNGPTDPFGIVGLRIFLTNPAAGGGNITLTGLDFLLLSL